MYKAGAAFDEVLKLAPTRAPTLIRSSVIAFERHNFDLAIELATKAVDVAPQNPDAYLQRGQVRVYVSVCLYVSVCVCVRVCECV